MSKPNWTLALIPLLAVVPSQTGRGAIAGVTSYGLRELPEPDPVVDDLPMSEMPTQTDVADVPTTVHVSLYTVNSPQESLEIELPFDGVVTPAQDAELKHFFRCRQNGREKSMAAGELALLADLSLRFPGHVIEIISGYRSAPYGVPHSKHFKGHAIDLRVRGVALTEVRDVMWREHHGVGVGWYPHQDFVHLDDRDGIAEAAWTSAYEGAEYQYHPFWASKARQGAPAPTAAPVQADEDGGATRAAR